MTTATEVKERPILFSGSMVRAILRDESPKTQTRRIVKPQPDGLLCWSEGDAAWVPAGELPVEDPALSDADYFCRCPYGQPGDVLWVQEAHQIIGVDRASRLASVRYVADGVERCCKLTEADFKKYVARKRPNAVHPGRFMYRSLSRIDLLNTAVRVERVQDISEADAIAEGVPKYEDAYLGEYPLPVTAKTSFEVLWDSINSKTYPWASNPWVWVVSFKRI